MDKTKHDLRIAHFWLKKVRAFRWREEKRREEEKRRDEEKKKKEEEGRRE